MRVLKRCIRAVGLSLCALVMACGAASEPETSADLSDCTLASVQSDYQTTTVSLLKDDGSLCADSILNSGSTAPQLLTALSGDVVLPSVVSPGGDLVLIDRYPNAVITVFDPQIAQVTMQMSVATGFASNPQDIFFISDTKAYVSRAETNAAPSEEPNDFDEGGDVLVLDMSTGRIVSRIDLQPYVTGEGEPSTIARPSQFAHAGGLVWLGLSNLSRDFQSAGPGTIVGIEPNTDVVDAVMRPEPFVNCNQLSVTPSGLGMWGSCAGLFADGEAAQKQTSGLYYVDLSGSEPAITWQRSGADLVGQTIGFGVTALSDERAAFIALGQLGASEADDRVMVVDRAAGEVEPMGVRAPAFQLGTPHRVNEGLLLVPVASNQDPRVERLMASEDGSWASQASINSNPSSALPPRVIGRFRF